MKRMTNWAVLGTTAVMAVSAFAPLAAHADNRQNLQQNKNLMRNLGIAGAALGAYGLLNHNDTLGVLGIAGAAVAGSQYEKDRHQQSQDHSRWGYFHQGDNNGGDYQYLDHGNGNGYRYQTNNNSGFGNGNGWNRQSHYHVGDY
jgi:hypothetical protein